MLNAGVTDRDSSFEGIAGLPVDGEHAAGPEDGFWLDHTELAFSGAVDNHFYGKLTTVLAEHEGASELELEEAFIQTLSMPAGFSVRAGRFLSNMGYLNSKHAHTDDYVERPLAYRGLIGSHYFDDGVRLNWVAPTDIYLELGAEAFKGSNFPASSGKTVGNSVVYVKTGGDFSDSLSWQAGLSWVQADNDPDFCTAHHHEDEHAHDEEHVEEHEAGPGFCDFKGSKDFIIADWVLKWAPDGNYKYQSLTWQTEWLQQDVDGHALHHDAHEEEEQHDDEFHQEWETFQAKQSGWYSSVVYQFSPNWSAGIRYSQVDVDEAYGDFTPKIYDGMLQYQFSHFSSVRFQFSKDKSMESVSESVMSLQYTVAIGDHGAHQF